MDGKILFRDPPDPKEKPQAIVFSVKGGGVGVKDVRDLDSVVTKTGAAIGVLLSIEEPYGVARGVARFSACLGAARRAMLPAVNEVALPVSPVAIRGAPAASGSLRSPVVRQITPDSLACSTELFWQFDANFHPRTLERPPPSAKSVRYFTPQYAVCYTEHSGLFTC